MWLCPRVDVVLSQAMPAGSLSLQSDLAEGCAGEVKPVGRGHDEVDEALFVRVDRFRPARRRSPGTAESRWRACATAGMGSVAETRLETVTGHDVRVGLALVVDRDGQGHAVGELDQASRRAAQRQRADRVAAGRS